MNTPSNHVFTVRFQQQRSRRTPTSRRRVDMSTVGAPVWTRSGSRTSLIANFTYRVQKLGRSCVGRAFVRWFRARQLPHHQLASDSAEKVEIEKPQRWSSNTKVWPKTMNPAQAGPADAAPSCRHARYRAAIWLFKAPETPELSLSRDLPGTGPGLRASLLGSRENGGLIPLREPRVGGDHCCRDPCGSRDRARFVTQACLELSGNSKRPR